LFVELDAPVMPFGVLYLECLACCQVPECNAHVEVTYGLDMGTVSSPFCPF